MIVPSYDASNDVVLAVVPLEAVYINVTLAPSRSDTEAVPELSKEYVKVKTPVFGPVSSKVCGVITGDTPSAVRPPMVPAKGVPLLFKIVTCKLFFKLGDEGPSIVDSAELGS